MRFIVAAVFGYMVIMASARPLPSALNSEELWERDSSTCDGAAMKTCAIDLVPTVAACALAAAQGELDVINDAACIGAAIQLGADFPSSCTACVEKFGKGAESEAEKIVSKLSHIHL
ncbi:hypothetical protein F5879DRAFT_991533 [Lentinula edodes]|uniref:Fungal calcium binding protein domain-containing protein n=1 Tax=Lentinula edodes TaxID=5353 RepID=A0A1Q3DWX9_LENED|nr:uncharacterized protein C8R40DRAFT_1167475 [Lentinula edodes]KAH7878748.1 hypothetical protein C8R40DRAFT_1167475 [Lentinula edodes]KAJ3901878.1 hypothetical protein F5879DRAFT_991533 [Lentinula edodes]KAJ3918949.1 hypothetical protein F5877DRAFT_78519 [Lentinula edodes]GAV99507.1 hypothetical protein LENED_000967 [Lentinula edodes]